MRELPHLPGVDYRSPNPPVMGGAWLLALDEPLGGKVVAKPSTPPDVRRTSIPNPCRATTGWRPITTHRATPQTAWSTARLGHTLGETRTVTRQVPDSRVVTATRRLTAVAT